MAVVPKLVPHPTNPTGMVSVDDSYEWRFGMQRLLGAAGDLIPYSILHGGQTISVSSEGAQAEEKYLVLAADIPDLLTATTPQYTTFGLNMTKALVARPHVRQLPGAPPLFCKACRCEPAITGKPIDPFETDPLRVSDAREEWLATYGQFAIATLSYEYDPLLIREALFWDSAGFNGRICDIKSAISGEFLNVGQQGMHLAAVGGAGSGGYSASTNFGTPAQRADPANTTYVPVGANTATVGHKAFDSAFVHTVQHVEHVVTLRHCFRIPYSNATYLMGKVNSDVLNTFVGTKLALAKKETLLFTGFVYNLETIRSVEGKPLWSIEFHFTERRINVASPDGITLFILGWNHAFVPGFKPTDGLRGWTRVLKDSETKEPLYEMANLDEIFQPDGAMPELDEEAIRLPDIAERGVAANNPLLMWYSQ